MINFIKKIFSKPAQLSYEQDLELKCLMACHHPSENTLDGHKKFFDKHHFTVGHYVYDPEWDEKTKLSSIFLKLLSIYEFNNKSDIILIHKDHKKIYLPNGHFVELYPGSIFVYDKKKIKVFY